MIAGFWRGARVGRCRSGHRGGGRQRQREGGLGGTRGFALALRATSSSRRATAAPARPAASAAVRLSQAPQSSWFERPPFIVLLLMLTLCAKLQPFSSSMLGARKCRLEGGASEINSSRVTVRCFARCMTCRPSAPGALECRTAFQRATNIRREQAGITRQTRPTHPGGMLFCMP